MIVFLQKEEKKSASGLFLGLHLKDDYNVKAV